MYIYIYILSKDNENCAKNVGRNEREIYFPFYLLFPKQFTFGVRNSILRCVRLVSGAVSVSLGSVFPIICLPSFVSRPSTIPIRLPEWVCPSSPNVSH